uniref:Uncharacterized protein n=1 Tax=Anguilla anguilla TaxID=7936 RepID=A0A0E9S6F3_ANGAN
MRKLYIFNDLITAYLDLNASRIYINCRQFKLN